MNSYSKNRISITILILTILLFVIIGAGVYFYFENKNLAALKTSFDEIDYSQSYLLVDKEIPRDMKGFAITQHSLESVSSEEYMTPLGFPIESYSSKWQGEKLKEIYNELLLNKHGDEINYISKIVVYGGVSKLGTKDSVVAGAHTSTQEHYQVFFDIESLLPPTLQYGLVSKQSVIELYNMDDYDTIEEAARTISHEYGHHYTIYYFMSSDEQVKSSDYYSLRNFENYSQPIFFNSQQDYFENHMWSIYEIAAEDYIQILGSPNSRQTQKYKDVYDVLQSGQNKYKIYADSNTSNVFPQENMNIALANEVEGLRDYYFSFIDEQNELESIPVLDFNINIEKKVSNGKVYYNVTWDNIFDDKDALYTLICYDKDKQIYSPIKTVYGNEKPIAKVGSVTKVSGNTLTTLPDGVTDEDRYFRLVVILADGRTIASDYFFADF